MDETPQIDVSPEPVEDAALAAIADRETPCSFTTGKAGTGKTYWARQQIQNDPAWGKLVATTGISAINLDTVTINSCLGYYDTDSLRDIYLQGRLTVTLHKLAQEYRNLVVDEVSMMDRQQLEILDRAFHEVNTQYRDLAEPFGLVLVGDFAQLPPVRAEWAFAADSWPQFASSTTRLTKVWRQDEAPFLTALDAARAGQGAEAAERLTAAGVSWHTSLATEFDGTTIVPKNDQVDRFNMMALSRVPSAPIHVRSRRWGRLRGEWKQVPERSEFKLGCYVMILANEWGRERGPDGELAPMQFANGDCGYIRDWDGSSFTVELVRSGDLVSIPRLVRDLSVKDKPPGWPESSTRMDGYMERQHRDKQGRYVLGQIEYYPLRLAYASTIHKSQGLSLDRVQFDFRNQFAAQPAMTYVALSRCKSLAGLRLVGQPEVFARKCNCDSRIKEWL